MGQRLFSLALVGSTPTGPATPPLPQRYLTLEVGWPYGEGMNKLTADTLTDEQIRELRATLPSAEELEMQFGSFEYFRAKECAWAIRPPVAGDAFVNDRRMLARARCAEILNARRVTP